MVSEVRNLPRGLRDMLKLAPTKYCPVAPAYKISLYPFLSLILFVVLGERNILNILSRLV